MSLFQQKRIYLDHASATPVRPEASDAYDRAAVLVGNPGTIHEDGVAAADSLRDSREKIAAELGCKAREIIFTGGLTEANNLAILGFARRLEINGKLSASGLKDTHWVTSAIEHPSVLECFSDIERRGGSVSHLYPDEKGRIVPEHLSRVLKPNTVFISIGWANSEIGTVQKLRSLAAVIHEHEKKYGTTIIFHTDAGQAPLYLSPHVHTRGVDLLSLGSAKLYGPRGIGALYVGRRAEIAPVVLGGAQERGLRGGTETVALAAGFATALVEAGKERVTESGRLSVLRDMFVDTIREQLRDALVNGDLKHGLPHLLNISLPHINSEYVVLALDRSGISLSTKAACSEGGVSVSHVVAALLGDGEKAPGENTWRAENTLRFSLGRDTTKREVDQAARELIRILKELPVS